MYFSNLQIALQEVPGEISICFSISGCKKHCDGCHSPFLWKEGNGTLLTDEVYKEILSKYAALASCVLFMGGEWHKKELISYLEYAKSVGYKTCLYSGEDHMTSDVLKHLTWIKTGKWESKLGGLESPTTNQKFKNVSTNKLLNHLFLN